MYYITLIIINDTAYNDKLIITAAMQLEKKVISLFKDKGAFNYILAHTRKGSKLCGHNC